MRQLPRAGDGQDGELDQGPSNNLAVGTFALVAEFGFSFLEQEGISYLKCLEDVGVMNLPFLLLFVLLLLLLLVGGGIARRTLWKTCSRLISFNLPFNSRTLATILSILLLSSLSILLVSPMAKSTVNFTPPPVTPAAENQPPNDTAAGPDGVKHNRCRPASAAEKVNFDGVLDEGDV